MDEVKEHKVYLKVPIGQCFQETGQAPMGTRWVDVNKGYDLNLDYRSRLVSQELKKLSWADDLFAATPPLEVKKMIFPCGHGGDRIPGGKTQVWDEVGVHRCKAGVPSGRSN